MLNFIELGKRIYDTSNPRELRRMVVFAARAVLHRRGMQRLAAYFAADPVRADIAAVNPYPFEQVTRAFFYKDSTFGERVRLVCEHISFLQQVLQPEWVRHLCVCTDCSYTVWQEEYEGQVWQTVLNTEDGQRKEGMLSVTMNLGQEHLYQIMFWIARDEKNHMALWIGAMQGPNMENARDVIKKITKRCFAYRTKNLILYMTQAVARAMGIKRIYAVTNYGYYANNHVRSDRKLKTNFEDFWLEAGGQMTGDKRFCELPLVEPRKSMDEVKTHKRNLYRKRFEFLDEVDRVIEENIRRIMKQDGREIAHETV